ncbi:hypothetical protein CALVIDRAFT_535074 [Calocera viscosa TUFC12733]|uniref:Uncharacterized protein n=1 Tax=Calocera viscosa (strain TUFC12733) TaxID=1330018 RepID=A0A167PNE6_CALVF|nr:hypothetical protein CALVIDRAFT_535074 [Calocera viscosa TUFC12733]
MSRARGLAYEARACLLEGGGGTRKLASALKLDGASFALFCLSLSILPSHAVVPAHQHVSTGLSFFISPTGQLSDLFIERSAKTK